MKCAIVTGANGFIGKAVCSRLLNEKVKTYAIVRNPETMREFQADPNLIIVQGNLENILELETVLQGEAYDAFYHFAWSGTSGESLKNVSVQVGNIIYTCNTLQLAKKLGCRKYIFAGTINELELLPFFEADTFKPRAASVYGITKLACDFICKTIAADEMLCYNTAIIGSCFGPGDRSWRIHNTFISNMLEHKVPKLVSGDVWHDWVYIDDVAGMLCALGEKSVNRKNYYIGHKSLRKLKDILYEVRDILCPELPLRFGDLKDTFQIDYSLVDLNAVHDDTGYECQTEFKTAILQTAEWVMEMKKMENQMR